MILPKKTITIIGIHDDGCVGLSSRAVNAVSASQVLAGGERHHKFFPQFEGQRVYFKDGLMRAVDELVELAAENNIAVLASGDPMFYGAGHLLLEKLGRENVAILPQPNSIQLAFARIGKKWDDASIITLHAKPIEGFVTKLKRIRKLAVLTDASNNPAAIARHMLEFNENNWQGWICQNLNGPGEEILHFETLEELATAENFSDLNVLVLERTDENWRPIPAIMNLHEDAFAKRMPKRGLITKKEVRLLSLGEMRIQPDDIIWDVGAASGSVSIEAAAVAYNGRSYAIELDPESVRCCRDNIKNLGIDNVRVIEGRAPEIFPEIEEDPNVVFIGGSKGSLNEIIKLSWDRLVPGGRLVVNAITFENIQTAYTTFKEMNLEANIIMLNISRAEPTAGYKRYDAQNPVHTFSVTKQTSHG